jgi:2-iminobutanoate/2-iminopropanoate deaminase
MQPVGASVGSHTRQALQNISTVLEAAGSSLSNIVKATVYLTTMENYAAHNKVWLEMVPDPKPARTCVAVKELPMGTDVSL